jgi:hypothetical protein
MIVRAADRQTFYDLAIRYTGQAENAVAIASANGRSPTADLEAGEEIEIPDGLPTKQGVVDYYAARQINPATRPEANRLTLSTAYIWINAAGETVTLSVSSNAGWINY